AWLIAIDADELVALDLRQAHPGELRRALESQPPGTDAVVFRTLEVVQRRPSYDNVIAEETLFKRPDKGLRRAVYDPFTRTERLLPAVYGHARGKSAVRVAAGPLPHTVHRFRRRDGRELKTVEMGYLLHYYSAG